MIQAERVAQFVKTRHVHDRVAHQRILACGSSDLRIERVDVGTNEHRRPVERPCLERTRLAVASTLGGYPEDANHRLVFRRRLEPNRALECALPLLERTHRDSAMRPA